MYISVGKDSLVTKLLFGGIAFGIVIIVGAVLSWLFFRYQIRDDSILIRSGVFKKKQLDIKFERIQGVNTQQNPVYRLLNLVTVTFDTAGSSGSEGNLPAVSREFANALRERIGSTSRTETAEGSGDAQAAEALVKLDWHDMIRIGLADRRALLVFAFLGPLIDQMDSKFEQFIESALQSADVGALDLDVGMGAVIAATIFFSIVLFLVAASVAAAFLRFHKFELFLEGRSLRSVGGLLTNHEHSMDLEKIQTLRLQQGIVQSWMRRYRMTARQAISGNKQRGQKLFVVPIVTAKLADSLRTSLLGPEGGALTQDPRSSLFAPISPYYMRSRILFVGLLPAIIVAAVLTINAGAIGLLALLWLPLVVLAAWRNWKRAGYLHDDREIVWRAGFMGYRTVGLLFRKVQRITVTQSRYQRHKNLASLRMYMASGSVRIPYIDHATARQLRDYILYKVESSQQAWH